MPRLSRETAWDVLTRCKITARPDFHTLGASTVDLLLEEAREYGYRRPKNANGSTVRYWYSYLCRLVEPRARSGFIRSYR